MTWAEATYKIFEDITGAMMTVAIILAICTRFWERLFDAIFGRDCDDDEE